MTRSRRGLRIVAVAFCSLLGAASITACVDDAPATPLADNVEVPSTLAVQRPNAHYKHVMVRFRVQQCGGVGVGSGFAIDAHHVLTNRHVVAAASVIQAETWDGRPLTVTQARVSPDNDLAIVTVHETLTETAKLSPDDPLSHSTITVVGYPLAKELHLSSGKILEQLTDGSDYGEGSVILTNATVKPGNSGGPMFGPLDTVVGVVFMLGIGTNYGIAIPVSIVHTVLDNDDFIRNYTCANVPANVF